MARSAVARRKPVAPPVPFPNAKEATEFWCTLNVYSDGRKEDGTIRGTRRDDDEAFDVLDANDLKRVKEGRETPSRRHKFVPLASNRRYLVAPLNWTPRWPSIRSGVAFEQRGEVHDAMKRDFPAATSWVDVPINSEVSTYWTPECGPGEYVTREEALAEVAETNRNATHDDYYDWSVVLEVGETPRVPNLSANLIVGLVGELTREVASPVRVVMPTDQERARYAIEEVE